MGMFKKAMGTEGKSDEEMLDKTIYVSNEKIDKAGVSWKKKSFWFRQEYLGKLKVIAHFEGKTTEQLVNLALKEYVKDKMDNSMAVRKLVKKSSSKIVRGTN